MTTEGTAGDDAVHPAAPDLGALMSQVLQARDAVQSAQQSAAAQVVEGSAGGGAVRITVTGGLEFQSVTIDPSVIDPSDAELLGDLVLAAIRDAVEQANALHAQALGGFDLGAITGLLGGS
jgi:DNA-binding YbaB/EbfC family protein